MIVADIPVVDAVLADVDGLDVPHGRIAVEDPLEPGQMLFLRTLDRVHRCAEVVGLHFTATETVYELRFGLPVAADTVAALTHRRPAPRRWVSDDDIESMLAGCASLLRTPTTVVIA